MGFFKSLFTGKGDHEADADAKAAHKKFEILKYDGMRAQRMGRTDYAIQCFSQALPLQSDFETMSYLARAYVQSGKLEEARAQLEQMVHLEPTHTESFLTLAHICFMQEDYEAMAKAAQQAIAIEAGNATAHFLLGKADYGMGNELMCVAHLTQAITLSEDFIEARLLRAEALLKMGQLTEAQEDIEAVLAAEADNEGALWLKGTMKEMEEKQEEAEQIYLHLIELNPFYEQAYLSLGKLYINRKSLEKAVALFDEAIEVNPNFAAAYHERGRAKLLLGDKDGATEDMKKGLELNPKEAEALNGQFDNLTRQTDILGL